MRLPSNMRLFGVGKSNETTDLMTLNLESHRLLAPNDAPFVAIISPQSRQNLAWYICCVLLLCAPHSDDRTRKEKSFYGESL